MPSYEDFAAANARRLSIVPYIREYTATHGMPPSRTEIAKFTGTHLNTTHGDLAWLRDRGFVEWDRGKPRSIRVTDK